MALGEGVNGLLREVAIGMVIAVISVLATIAATTTGTISRAEVQKMVEVSEQRFNTQMTEIRSKQDFLSAKMEQLLTEQIRTSTKLDHLIK